MPRGMKSTALVILMTSGRILIWVSFFFGFGLLFVSSLYRTLLFGVMYHEVEFTIDVLLTIGAPEDDTM